jgi:hypothetical protein
MSNGVKFGARPVCPMCNAQGKRIRSGAARDSQDFGISGTQRRARALRANVWARAGRLAVSLDRITNALVLAGQHGVDCTSPRNPAVPAMDIQMINQELLHAKELVQSVMEEIRQMKSKLEI